jgi:ligand-binding SRPBCC domain-containing protein
VVRRLFESHTLAAEADMSTVRVTFESKVPTTPVELWNWSTSVRGVDAEMGPILKLDFPKGMTHIPRDGSGLGKPLGNCKFLLFGIVPVDLSRLTFVEVEPGRRFVEESPLLSMKEWRHERVITPGEDGTRVVDNLEFTPRFATGIVKWFISKFFQHRHAVLLREFRERRSVARPQKGANRVYMQPRESA